MSAECHQCINMRLLALHVPCQSLTWRRPPLAHWRLQGAVDVPPCTWWQAHVLRHAGILFSQYSLPAVSEAVAKAKAGHFQLACAAAWEGQHSRSCDTGINHPNQVCSRPSCPQPRSSLALSAQHAGHAWQVQAQGQEGCCRPGATACAMERSSLGPAGTQRSDGNVRCNGYPCRTDSL